MSVTSIRIEDQREKRIHLHRYRVIEILDQVIVPIGLMKDLACVDDADRHRFVFP